MSFGDWDKLLYGIQKGECILFLGPDVPLSASGDGRSPTHSLSERLRQALDDAQAEEHDQEELAQIAQHYLAHEDELGLEMEVASWHKELEGQVSPVHDDLATLPFKLIVSISHDPLMAAALRRAEKEPLIERYHYRGENKDLLPEPSVQTPLLFHLYGLASEPDSLVITETQLLEFLSSLIAKTPPLPNDVNAALTNGRLYLFVGFGLHQWYFRILLHVLKVLKKRTRAFAFEAPHQGDERLDDAVLFYRDNYKLEIHQQNIFDFVSELRERYVPTEDTGTCGGNGAEAPIEAKTAAPGTTVFICHASEDKDTAREIHEALQRAGLTPWLDQESLRGGDLWDGMIESTIKGVDYFVVLNSENLEAKSRQASYVNKEIKLALRAEDWRLGAFIVPVKIDQAPLLGPFEPYHAVDLTASDGMRDLVRAIKRQVGRS